MWGYALKNISNYRKIIKMDNEMDYREKSNGNNTSDNIISQNNTSEEREVRLIELILVLFVSFGGAIYGSLYQYFSGVILANPKAGNGVIFSGIIYQIGAIAVLFYVLFRQNRTVKDLGVSIQFKDILFSIGIYVFSNCFYFLAIIIFQLLYKLIGGSYYNPPRITGSLVNYGVSFYSIVLMFINPIFEELIVRAYTMMEIELFTNSKVIAVIVSLSIQFTYHLYQGVFNSLFLLVIFLFYSIYYAKTKKLTPVILAHLYGDLLALYNYS
jgi:membrane protease YdiL (CAAX protease family)